MAVLGVAFLHLQGNLFHPELSWLHRFLQHSSYWSGVDLFFAISGFVIGRSLLPPMLEHQHHLRNQLRTIWAFWIRRVWRLLPSAWLWLMLILVASIFFNESGVFGTPHANAMAALAGMLNIANARGFGGAFFQYENGASFVYWSLSLEEQFYFLLPILALCLRKRIGALMIVLFLIQLFLVRTPLLMSFRNGAIALGVLLSIAESGIAYRVANPSWLLHLGGMRWIVPLMLFGLLSVLASPDLQNWRWRISAIAVVSATLVWLASYDSDYLFPTGRFKQALVWVGVRSYAIYLIHIPAYYFIREAAFRLGIQIANADFAHTALLFMAAVAVMTALADLNYRVIERPLRRYGRSLANRCLNRNTPPIVLPTPLHPS
ncbi:acyltransferase [Dyella acidisoli]|uniref:Acyltransferase n=2 Tax=Dyella acidisoli TaxID=1867834 RepID=A0ABQ5XXM0_9GAMM|nr:acyltransferase [Dyella acidisoli]